MSERMLTAVQVRIIRLRVRGVKSWAIAESLGMTEKAVQQQIYVARRATGLRDLRDLAEIAESCGENSTELL